MRSAANADDNPDAVIIGAGFRSRISDQLSLGIAYEVPLTDEEDGLMESRLTLDAVWTF